MEQNKEQMIEESMVISHNTLKDRVRVKFVIPIKGKKKWWQFWKEDDSEKAIADLIAKCKEDIPGDFFLPAKNTENGAE